MKVHIVNSFVQAESPECGFLAPSGFAVGEEHEVTDQLGRNWIEAGLAVAIGGLVPESAMAAPAMEKAVRPQLRKRQK